MIGKLFAVGVGIAFGSTLKPETRKAVGDAARAVKEDCAAIARERVEDLKRFWREKVEPHLENGPPKGGDARPTHPQPPASA